MEDEKIFRDRSIVIYLSYAPAGFGHLRVADALYHGLPEYVTPILLGTHDYSVSFLHRITSIHPVFRAFLVWTQGGIREKIFTILYRRFLHSTAQNLKTQLITTVNQRIDPVKTIIIVATHFGIAHQISVVKAEVEKRLDIKIILIVQVTDDSPQLIWYVHHADLIFAPSENTAEILKAYDKRKMEKKPKIVVIPYPISPYLGRKLTEEGYENRKNQVDPQKERETQMVIPLSGAAVGTKDFEVFIQELHQINKRFNFVVIVKNASYTKPFIDNLRKHSSYVSLFTSKNDKEIVNLYEQSYMKDVIALEITKPSEQAFKALYYPHQRGGAILLFASPVGRQEFDNLDFLRRHRLIPSISERAALWELSKQNPADPMFEIILKTCKNWRGLELPEDPHESVRFINWCFEKGIFLRMMKHEKPKQVPPHYDEELSPDGVKYFWKEVSKFVKKTLSESD